MEEKEELQGYLHDASTVKKSEKVPYFDMCIQTESQAFSDLEEGKTYQFDNFVVSREYNTKDIILAKPKTGCKAV